jgi:hypothetical protein
LVHLPSNNTRIDGFYRSCCYKGVKHEGEAKGELKMLGDIEVYYAYPENKSTEYGILLITDVIGHKFINAQLIVGKSVHPLSILNPVSSILTSPQVQKISHISLEYPNPAQPTSSRPPPL